MFILKIFAALTLTLCCLLNAPVVQGRPFRIHPNQRSEINTVITARGFHGKLRVRNLDAGRIQIGIVSQHQSSFDTIVGHSLVPVMVNGHKRTFYFGRFGQSNFPMLIVAVTDPNRVQDSRVLCYQIGQHGTLIGQQVLIDNAVQHRHSEELSGGRYELAAIEPRIGAIYSIDYQEAHFEGYYVSYEKLRIRQWDQVISAFIETDQGFLRDPNGRLVESTKFNLMNDRSRERVFLENIYPIRPSYQKPHGYTPRIIPASASRR